MIKGLPSRLTFHRITKRLEQFNPSHLEQTDIGQCSANVSVSGEATQDEHHALAREQPLHSHKGFRGAQVDTRHVGEVENEEANRRSLPCMLLE